MAKKQAKTTSEVVTPRSGTIYDTLRNVNLNFRNIANLLKVKQDTIELLETMHQDAKHSNSQVSIELFEEALENEKNSLIQFWEADRRLFMQSIKLAGVVLQANDITVLETVIEDHADVEAYCEHFIN